MENIHITTEMILKKTEKVKQKTKKPKNNNNNKQISWSGWNPSSYIKRNS